jgi:hypothetical protein
MGKNYVDNETFCRIWNEVFISMKHMGFNTIKEVTNEAIRIYEKLGD